MNYKIGSGIMMSASYLFAKIMIKNLIGKNSLINY